MIKRQVIEMERLFPNQKINALKDTEENEELRKRKLRLEIENESDDEHLKELILLHLDDMQILNSEKGKKIKRDFGRVLKETNKEVTMEDIEYEIYKYINQLADQYIELEDLLEQNCLTFDEALRQAEQFKEKFYHLLAEYSIGSQSLVVICHDLMERISQQSDNPDLQYLYLCVVTDFGLLNEINAYERTGEQRIRNYFRQQELLKELSEFWKLQSENVKKYQELLQYLKKMMPVKNNPAYEEDFDFLYRLTIQHTFLHDSIKNQVYMDNLNNLQMSINHDERLRSVKPYIIFAVLARKTGMMQKRENFIPNLKAVFQYQDYNIYKNNGKNFNLYASELELYDHLQRSYMDDSDVDMELCDFCFANLSPLSEWYYRNCEWNQNIPMNLKTKLLRVMPKSFPYILSYEEYDKMNEDEIQLYSDAARELMEKMLQTAEKFFKI